MVVDHIGYLFFPDLLFLRAIGRLTMPIMAFFAAEGFRKTRNIHKYLLRLLLFAVLSELPFCLVFHPGALGTFVHFYNVVYTILLGVAALWLGSLLPRKLVFLPYFLCAALAEWVGSDWSWIGVLMIVAFYEANRNTDSLHPVNRIRSFTGLSLVYLLLIVSIFVSGDSSVNYINLFGLASIVPLFAYNGKKGADIKYLFYIFYPAHLLILYFICCTGRIT